MNTTLRSFLLVALALAAGCGEGGAAVFGENHAGKYKTKLESGLAHFDAANFADAQVDLTAAYDSAVKMNDDAKAAVALQNLASLALRQGKNAEAKTHATAAAELLAKNPESDAFLVSAVNLQLAKAATHLADFPTATDASDKALAGFEKAQDAKGELFDALLTKGMLQQAMGKQPEAQATYKKAIDVERSRRKVGDETHELAAAFTELGRSAVDAGDLDAANQHFDRANKILKSLRMLNKDESNSTKPIESWVACNVAWLLHKKDQPIKLTGVFADALKTFEKLGRPGRETAFVHREYGRLLLETQKYSEAELQLKRSLELCHGFYGPNHPELAKTLEVYASLLEATNRADEGAEHRAKAKAIIAALSQPAVKPPAAKTPADDAAKQQASAK
jgi:tetratricopeptide (TPR) repeat protein